MNITDRINTTIKELATENGRNEADITWHQIAIRLAKKLNEVKNNVDLDNVKLCCTCKKEEAHFSKLFMNYYCDSCYNKKINEA